MVKHGLGLGLTIIGNMWLLATFQRNLHSIREQPSTQQSRIFKYISSPFLIFCFILTLFISLSFFPPSIFELENTYYVHIRFLLTVTFVSILIPKYYINQNPNLKLYVSVYHHQPPPVLPWQLPNNFDHTSVTLICVKYKNE